ncbi:MAG TPA: hypothetical protein PLW83_03775 [Deltaproteobacteria bacterium]|nr:hypothetical protein [Deltaproteobacteria bacterium]
MPSKKEKRGHERILLADVRGMVEHSNTSRPVTLVNASVQGVCIAGEAIEAGTVVRLSIEDNMGVGGISLYCRSAWSSEKTRQEKLTGLTLLNTNRVLFTKDLAAYGRLLETARTSRGA